MISTYLSIKKYPLTNITFGWMVMLLCGFLGGWTIADTSWKTPYTLLVVLMGGVAALRVGLAMEHQTSIKGPKGRTPHLIWFAFALLGIVVGALGVFHRPALQQEVISGFNSLLGMAALAVGMMTALVLAVGIAEKYLHAEDAPHSPDKNVMPWWVSSCASAMVVAMLGISGLHMAVKFQSNPETVWGWWNKKHQTEQQYQQGLLSVKQFESQLEILEDYRVKQYDKKVAQTLLPEKPLMPRDLLSFSSSMEQKPQDSNI